MIVLKAYSCYCELVHLVPQFGLLFCAAKHSGIIPTSDPTMLCPKKPLNLG